MPIPTFPAVPARNFPGVVRVGAYVASCAVLSASVGCTLPMWHGVLEPFRTASAQPNEPYHMKLKRLNLVIERLEIDDRAGREASGRISAARAKKHMPNVPVALRIYSLKHLEKFSTASAASLRNHDKAVLGTDRMGRIDLSLKPGEAVQIPVAIPEGTRYVGVVVFFRDRSDAEWQLSVPLSRWENEDPVALLINGNRLEMASD